MKIVLSYLHYPMAIARYFDFALRRRDDVEIISVGPYTGQWIPWKNGIDLPLKYAKSPDIVVPGQMRSFSPIPINWVESQLPENWKPDLWLQIDAGWWLQGKPKHGKNVIVATDPHVLNYNYQRSVADTFYCMQGPKSGYIQAEDKYLPYAYDSVYHIPVDVKKEYDVCLIGLQYAERAQLVQRLKEHGVSVFFDTGYVFEDAQEIICSAPSGINWSSRKDLTARVFELLGMKRLAFVNDVPHLSDYFQDGKDLVVFQNVRDAVDKIRYYLDHQNEAQEIAEHGHKTVQPETWDNRIDQILKDHDN